jgi:repressor LexA
LNNFRDIFNKLKIYFDLKTDKEVALKLNINYNTIKTWNNRGKVPLEKLLTSLKDNDIDINWLLGGKEDNSNTISLPYYPNIYASAGGGAYSEIQQNQSTIKFDKTFLQKNLGIINYNNIHIIKAVGESMEPTIKDGDMLLVLPLDNEHFTIKNSSIYVVQYEDMIMVKRLEKHPIDKTYTLISDNSQVYEPLYLDNKQSSELKIIGRVLLYIGIV